jgi:hypothetical protein
MGNISRLARYKLILDKITVQPAGCTVRELLNLTQATDITGWSEISLRRDLADLLDVQWIEIIDHHYFISPDLGFYLVRRTQVLSNRLKKLQAEFHSFLISTVNREE